MFLRWIHGLLSRLVKVLWLGGLKSACHRVLRIIPILEGLIILSLYLNSGLLFVLAWKFEISYLTASRCWIIYDHRLPMTRWTKSLVLFDLDYKLFGILYRCSTRSLFHLYHIRGQNSRNLHSLLLLRVLTSVLSTLDREFPLLFALIHELRKVINLLIDVFRSSLFWVKRVKEHLSLSCCFFFSIIRLFTLLILIFMDPLSVLPAL